MIFQLTRLASELSHKRHISYCSRNQTRLRVRPRSCRSCNAAKAKCTFQAPCWRCTAKGLDCVYEQPRRTVAAAYDGEADPNTGSPDGQNIIDLPDQAAYLQERDLSNVGVSIEDVLQVTDAFDTINSTDDTTEDVSREHLPLQVDDPFAHGHDGARDFSTVTAAPLTNKADPCDTWAWPYSFIQPRMGQVAQAPWSTWTTNIANYPTPYTPNLNDMFSLSQRRCLALLQPSSHVVQHNTHLMVQALRAYPLMMLRRETLPPFIHPHWHRQSSPALPDPLSNCMSIAQMYAFRSEETKPFLWRTIKAEDERFTSQVTDSCSCIALVLMRFHTAPKLLPTRSTGCYSGTDHLYDHAIRGRGLTTCRSESAAGRDVSG